MSSDAYGRLARFYDPATARSLDPIRRLVRQVLTGLRPHRVLDACCGTGRLVAMLREAGLPALGVDASPAMLARAGRAATVARMDVRRLAFADDTFDAAVICLALHENAEADRLAMASELCRVTRPQGHVLFVDYATPAAASISGLLVNLAERSAGTTHYRHYRDFLSRKGVEAFPRRLGLAVEAALPCLWGQAALIVSRVAPHGPAASGPARPRPDATP